MTKLYITNQHDTSELVEIIFKNLTQEEIKDFIRDLINYVDDYYFTLSIMKLCVETLPQFDPLIERVK